jgi:hypothetical protein
LEHFFENHRGSGAVRFFYKPSRRGSGAVAFFINHRGAAAAAFQPRWTSLFRLILQTLPDLRTKLESAIRRQQQQKDEKESNYASKSYLSSINSTSQAPSLPLRMDFSNFKSS